IAWQKENGIQPMPASYTVRGGDSLSLIAERHGVSLAALKRENGLSGDVIHVGQTLKLPGGGSVATTTYTEHRISRGETLSGIATSYAVPLSTLRETNQLKSDTIRVGQILKIPTS